ncbi:MAG: leucine-rich repeat domain-containing protein [Spirochaetes bacterium]|nr:leucine-rich repeat domain-containing protein [Spirochaetota bacterium]
MEGEIKSIYRKLKKTVSENRLKEISSEIIQAYKAKNYPLLEEYASFLDLDCGSIKRNRLFSTLIQTYHPDRYNAINSEIDCFFRNRDIDSLRHCERVFTFERRQKAVSVEYQEDYDIDGDDFYQFGMNIVDDEHTRYDEADDTDTAVEIDVYEALSRELCGGTSHIMTPFDLNSLDGELDLSDYGILHLDGIEHLSNVTSLNLSGNRIGDLGPLSSLLNLESLFIAENRVSDVEALSLLSGLKELDLSFNAIEHVNPLFGLYNLKYVNLTGNRIKDASEIDMLRDKGIIVVY